jgi:hypothetical protein
MTLTREILKETENLWDKFCAIVDCVSGRTFKSRNGLSGILEGDQIIISYKGRAIRATSNPELAARFANATEIISKGKSPTKQETAYKATAPERMGVVIPGFMTVDFTEALGYMGSDWGGSKLAVAKLPLMSGVTSKAFVLNGIDGDVVVMPGLPNIIKLGNERIVLIPIELKPY